MNKDEFLSRFTLLKLAKSAQTYQHDTALRAAAVLIVLSEGESDNTLEVLLTKRASHLKHHPSQISFPGGKAEKVDNSIIDTALRETYEEVGISPQSLTVIGQMPPYQTISGFYITPVIALSTSALNYKLDSNEVDEVFHVPLKHFLTTNDHHVITSSRKGKTHDVHFYPYHGRNIWGATAVILKDLATQLSHK